MRAIDADAVPQEFWEYEFDGKWRGCTIKDLLDSQPTIQPEIVRCKDCKHHWTHKCMDSIPIERCDLEQTFYDAEVDYCSLAERREVNHESN